MEVDSTSRTVHAAAPTGAASAGRHPMIAPAAATRDGAGGARRGASAAAETSEAIDTLMLVEHLMVTFYYTALTSHGVMSNSALSGPSADPNNPGLPPGGNPAQVRYLQAALDAEAKHAVLLSGLGGKAAPRRYYFPASIFARMGTTTDRVSFLGVLDMLETACVGAYGAAAIAFIRLGRPDLAVTAAETMGVESEHRTLGRVIANITPANNHTLETAPYDEVSEALTAVRPFLTGERFLFAGGRVVGIGVPTRGQVARIVGKHGTRLVRKF